MIQAFNYYASRVYEDWSNIPRRVLTITSMERFDNMQTFSYVNKEPGPYYRDLEYKHKRGKK